ncbi:MAG: prepilin-type N-terminal cleavage/methylation domain-containing protein [Deltaproteobacteria bacterium]|nr:prepilin-type N-terminal cleavage/methylation domain-containing protein [Deltaproteobacteria bacterium]
MKKLLFNNLGFSLMELVLVLALVSIVAISSFPMLADTQAITLDGAARKLEGDMRYAQNLSMTTGNDHGVRTTGGAGGTTYEVYEVATDTVVTSPYDHLPMSEDLSNTGEEYHGITFPASDTVTFDDVGTPTAINGDGSFVLRNENGDTKTITINNSGLITMQ